MAQVVNKEYDEDEQKQIDETCRANDTCEDCPLNINNGGGCW